MEREWLQQLKDKDMSYLESCAWESVARGWSGRGWGGRVGGGRGRCGGGGGWEWWGWRAWGWRGEIPVEEGAFRAAGDEDGVDRVPC